MASRCRSISKSATTLLKYTISKPSSKPSLPNLSPIRPSPTFSRSVAQLGSLQSLLPLHSAVSSARLTSCLGVGNSRSMCQELGQSVPR
uniref:Uncharacterized protein n=1 Tax=Kalanchoe fedtschenkoi TaxID=63787 RepID=A0A7N0ZRY1_KALFE